MSGIPALELEHAIGFSGGNSGNLCYLPQERGKYVYASGGSIIVGDFETANEQVFLKGHNADVSAMAISKSGEVAITAQYGNTADVIVWDFLLKKVMYRFEEHDFGVQCVAISHDDRLMVSVGVKDDGKMFVWDLATGKICAMINVNAQGVSVNAVAFGGFFKDIKRRPTTDYQFVTVGDQNVCVWRLNPFKGTLEKHVIKQGRVFNTVTFSQDYEHVFAGTTSGDLSRFRMKNESFEVSLQVCKVGVGALDVGRDSQGRDIVVVGGGDGIFSVWNIAEDYRGQLVHTRLQELRTTGGIVAVNILNDATGCALECLIGTNAGFIQRINLRDDTRGPLLVSENHFGPVAATSFFSKNSNYFATCGQRDQSIRIWDAGDYAVTLKTQVRDAGAPLCLDMCLDTIFTGWEDGKIRCHNCENGEWLWNIDEAHSGGVTGLRQSHNEKFLLSCGGEGAVRLWEVKTKELITTLKEHKGRVNEVVIYRDDTHALSCGRDRSFRCWDLMAEKRETSHTQRMGAINSIALSFDEKVVLTVGQERKLTVWDLRERLHVAQADIGDDGEGRSVAVANTMDNIVATGGSDQLVKLWDLRNMQCLTAGQGHSNTITQVKFAPDDKQIVSSGDDGCVLIWNMYPDAGGPIGPASGAGGMY